MENPDHQLSSKTLNQSGFPQHVLKLCDGLLRINSDFFELHLQKLLNDFESILFKSTENSGTNDTQTEQFAHLRNLKRTRHDFIPRFLAGVEHQLAGIRTAAGGGAAAKPVRPDELHLLDTEAFDEAQVRFEITSRCESQNSFDLFLLGQRFGVLAGRPAFDAEQLPLGPKNLCLCLQDAIQCLDLDAPHTKQIYYLFERYVFTGYSDLLTLCNNYLISNGVLPNLSYVPFRNPELRHKKSPIALLGKGQPGRASEESADAAMDPKVLAFKPGHEHPQAHEPKDPARIEENFSQLRHLLAKRKQLLNKLSSFSSTYLSEAGRLPDGARRATDAPPELLKAILDDFQLNAAGKPNARASIQHLKHDLMAQLRNQSSSELELTLNEEDSDAIDLVGLVMDNALKDVNPNSVASQLLSIMQTPLIRVVLQDKTFFSDHVHPARQMLNIIAETGFNWLDENGGDDALHEKISSIVNRTAREFDGDNQALVEAYRETNELLQTLIRKAEAAERRQIEAARGKERLSIARKRAALVMAELTAKREMPVSTRSLLNKAWTDVMALTELRQGSDSQNWKEQKVIAESIIAANEPDAEKLDQPRAKALKEKIQHALALVGYHHDEAESIADNLVAGRTSDQPDIQITIPEKIRFGENTQAANIHVYELDERQMELAEEIRSIPVGTWLEFIVADSAKPVRRKLAWKSHVTHNILFVNQRGQKTSEMMVEELAVELSEGRARIQVEDRRNLVERAFENVLNSLRSLLPGRNGKDHD
ncbi:MAG TPA: DUF1631 family protein [Arenimonas sp.]|nr:DUF1631 family protein [Arenimonas sp.]